MNTGVLVIPTTGRLVELKILLKSLLHSDMLNYISKVVVLDDNSRNFDEVQSLMAAFYKALATGSVVIDIGIRRAVSALGINKNLLRAANEIDEHKFVWVLNDDMLVFSKYFERCMSLHSSGVLVSGFLAPHHKVVKEYEEYTKAKHVGGCSLLFSAEEIEQFNKALRAPTKKNGFDWHLQNVFKEIRVTKPSASQHIGVATGMHQKDILGFGGAFATI